MKKILLISLLIAITSGCSSIPLSTKPVEVVTIAEPVPMYHPPLPLELQLVDIDWQVLSPEILQEYLADLESGSAPPTAFYSLTSKEYENLSMNMAEIKRYLRDTLSIVEYYREYDKPKESKENSSEAK